MKGKPECLKDNFMKKPSELKSGLVSLGISRPASSSSNKNLIKDVKCQGGKDIRDWKKYVKYDEETNKWTALKK